MIGGSFFSLFFPDERVQTVEDVDYERLSSSGIKAVVFDLDNTIAKWGEDSLPSEVVDLFERLDAMGLKVGILSNSRRKNVGDFGPELPFPHFFNANKPSGKGFRLLLQELGVSPEEAAMVGDQLFTDVLGANRINMYTIRVDPIDPDQEYSFTKINRIGERLILFLREVYRSLKRFRENTC